jgi:hypothetical protein
VRIESIQPDDGKPQRYGTVFYGALQCRFMHRNTLKKNQAHRLHSFRRDSRVPNSGTVLWLCGQAEHLEGVRVLPFGDEFREEIGFGAIQEKFGQALA